MEKNKKFLAFIESFDGVAPEGLIGSIREGFLVLVEDGEDVSVDADVVEGSEDSDVVSDSVGDSTGNALPDELDKPAVLEDGGRKQLLDRVYKKLTQMLLNNVISRDEVQAYVDNQYPELAEKFAWKPDGRGVKLDRTPVGGPAWVVESDDRVVDALVEGYFKDVVMKKSFDGGDEKVDLSEKKVDNGEGDKIDLSEEKVELTDGEK